MTHEWGEDFERWQDDIRTDLVPTLSLSAVADWGPAEDWTDWADAAGYADRL